MGEWVSEQVGEHGNHLGGELALQLVRPPARVFLGVGLVIKSDGAVANKQVNVSKNIRISLTAVAGCAVMCYVWWFVVVCGGVWWCVVVC